MELKMKDQAPKVVQGLTRKDLWEICQVIVKMKRTFEKMCGCPEQTL